VTVANAQTSIYLDVCTLCRPYDDQNLMRIRLETDACYLILQHIQNGRYTMIVSPVHFREVTAIAETRERAEVTVLLSESGRKCYTPADLVLPMPHTLPLRRPPPTSSLRVMIDCSGNVGGRRYPCGS
jgi:hypothetical protein